MTAPGSCSARLRTCARKSKPRLNCIPREGIRQSPIAGVVLANADIDHVLGLLLLRELQPLRIYATASIRRILTEDNSMFAMLQRIPEPGLVDRFRSRKTVSAASTPAGEDSGLLCRALSLGNALSRIRLCARQSQLASEEASLGPDY